MIFHRYVLVGPEGTTVLYSEMEIKQCSDFSYATDCMLPSLAESKKYFYFFL